MACGAAAVKICRVLDLYDVLVSVTTKSAKRLIIIMLIVIVALFGVRFGFVTSAEDGCVLGDGTIVPQGEQYDVPGICALNVCIGGDEWTQGNCGIDVTAAGWEFVPEDPSKGYPECCGHAVPPCRVVPDVVDHVESYRGPHLEFPTLDITYAGVTADHCAELTPSQTQNEPEVSYNGENLSWSLLALVDPDAPAKKKGRQFLHWLVGNIPESRVEEGEALAEYVGPSPPKGTGLHRYVFLLYKQAQKIAFDQPRIPADLMEHRGSFSIREFAKKYNLGDPVVANVFKAKHAE